MTRNIVQSLRKLVEDEIRGIYTVSFVRVEEVDSDTRRAVVSLKSDDAVVIDDVPIASPYAGDGKGMITPVEQDDEGLVVHAREPLKQQIQQRGEQSPESRRRFQLEDAVLLPLVWLDEDDVPEHEDGEFQIAVQDDGSVFRMLADGRVRVEHSSGNVIAMDSDGVVFIGDEESAEPLAFQEHTHDFQYDGGGDNSSTLTGTTETPNEEGTQDLNST